MTRAYKLSIAGKVAIIAALMGGSSLSFAQDSAPAPASAVPPAAAVETTIAPPAAVRTLPTANDVVNPAAAQEAATEVASKRQAAAAPKPRIASPVRANTLVAATPVAAIAAEPVNEPSADVAPASAMTEVSDVNPVTETTDIVPTEEVAAPPENSLNNEDITLFGGIAAAIAAVGLGAVFASRRRRRVVTGDRRETVTPAPEYVAPRPIREDPAFQKFAAAPTPEHVAPRGPNLTRSDVPVTDPLFSMPMTAGPITDPLFAPKTVVEQPITDPLFANNDRFTGRSPPFDATRRVTPEPAN